MLRSTLLYLPTPVCISYGWNLGSILFFSLLLQIFTGLLLVVYYIPAESAYLSVQFLSREVTFGWLLRLLHFNGASVYFVLLYLHILKATFYLSYRLRLVWIVGVFIFYFSVLVAFLGYGLLWSQISYWACVVITSLLSTIPYVGNYILPWLWGGYSVGVPTLNLFFVFHFLLPFIILVFVLLHLLLLHESGSTSVLGYSGHYQNVWFSPSYSVNDLLGIPLFFSFFFFFLLFPYLLGDSEIFVEANYLSSPLHIVPEWYFLFAYAILRSVPHNGLGVLLLVLGLLLLFFFSFSTSYPSIGFLCNNLLFSFFFFNFIFLSCLGQCLVEDPYIGLGGLVTIAYYALFFLVFLNILLGSILFCIGGSLELPSSSFKLVGLRVLPSSLKRGEMLWIAFFPAYCLLVDLYYYAIWFFLCYYLLSPSYLATVFLLSFLFNSVAKWCWHIHSRSSKEH